MSRPTNTLAGADVPFDTGAAIVAFKNSPKVLSCSREILQLFEGTFEE